MTKEELFDPERMAKSRVRTLIDQIKSLEELAKEPINIVVVLVQSDKLAKACDPALSALNSYVATFERDPLEVMSMEERGARFTRERIEELQNTLHQKRRTHSGVDTPNYLRGLHSELVMHRENMYPSLQYPRFGR